MARDTSLCGGCIPYIDFVSNRETFPTGEGLVAGVRLMTAIVAPRHDFFPPPLGHDGQTKKVPPKQKSGVVL